MVVGGDGFCGSEFLALDSINHYIQIEVLWLRKLPAYYVDTESRLGMKVHD